MMFAIWLLIALVFVAVVGVAGVSYLAYHTVKLPW